MRIRRRLQIEGRVQGVGYRMFLAEGARRLGVDGFARNADDGSVLAEVEGDTPAVEAFLTAAREGPGRVEQVEVTVADPTDARGFQITG